VDIVSEKEIQTSIPTLYSDFASISDNHVIMKYLNPDIIKNGDWIFVSRILPSGSGKYEVAELKSVEQKITLRLRLKTAPFEIGTSVLNQRIVILRPQNNCKIMGLSEQIE
jgi:hypothetical protein